MLSGICPSCSYRGDLEGFLVEVEARRAIASVAALDPAIGRALPAYLRLFGTGKRGLHLRRAVALIDELVSLVEAGDVCPDARGGVRRQATPAMWAAGIEQMLASPPDGALPNHRYLIKVVFTLAEKHEADAERQQEEDRRTGRHRESTRPPAKEDRLANAIAFANHLFGLDRMTAEERDAHIADARARHGAAQ